MQTNYLVDPAGLGDVVSEYTSAGSLIAHFTYGIGLVSQVDSNNSAVYYDFDVTGSTTGITGTAGNYINSYSYLPFGTIATENVTIASPFTFVGQAGMLSVSNGTIAARYRDYLPTLGRFTSPDPSGFVSGDYNLYRYSNNDPVDNSDPSGLCVARDLGEQIGEWAGDELGDKVGEKIADKLAGKIGEKLGQRVGADVGALGRDDNR